ncbi:ergothioneine biosynthesis protein EgtC [Lolliginicoccus levis]|uniref:ergothioneine biosynthesis protein EgtC n=1 Tax=Lolliginicoccus levis TaxID=2919542 RepID=UPI00241F44BA|nr:ergothioneine biosynthesis protein EgtC [Lolliginicoccus levis]
MCRHLARIGGPITVGDVPARGAHSLAHQAHAPRYMRGTGTLNVDGYGVAWSNGAGWQRYRRAVPPWADPSGEAVLGAVTATAVMAVMRGATTGMPLSEHACAPFTAEQWAFSHNGYATGWPGSLVPLAGEIPLADLMTLDASVDSAVLWAWLRHRLRTEADPAALLLELVSRVAEAAPGSRMNLLLSDGTTILATAWGHSLAWWRDGGEIVVASEPTDDAPGWQWVPDGQLLVARPGGVETIAIASTASPPP